VISGLALCIKKDFKKYISDFWQYLSFVLGKPEDSSLFKVSTACLGDIARALEEDFGEYLKIMDPLMGLLNDPKFDRELKLSLFTCIGDVMLGVKQLGLPYLENLMAIYDMAFDAVVMLEMQDNDNEDYAEALKERLIESYTCVLHGTSASKSLIKHLPRLMKFISQTCNKSLNPTVVLILISDLL